jgi:hypothetical protein
MATKIAQRVAQRWIGRQVRAAMSPKAPRPHPKALQIIMSQTGVTAKDAIKLWDALAYAVWATTSYLVDGVTEVPSEWLGSGGAKGSENSTNLDEYVTSKDWSLDAGDVEWDDSYHFVIKDDLGWKLTTDISDHFVLKAAQVLRQYRLNPKAAFVKLWPHVTQPLIHWVNKWWKAKGDIDIDLDSVDKDGLADYLPGKASLYATSGDDYDEDRGPAAIVDTDSTDDSFRWRNFGVWLEAPVFFWKRGDISMRVLMLVSAEPYWENPEWKEIDRPMTDEERRDAWGDIRYDQMKDDGLL